MTVEPLLRDLPEPALPIWQIRELSDLYVDALVRDDVGQIVFLSVFGRDGAIQQLFAALHLPVSQGGIDRVTLDIASSACPAWTAGETGTVGEPKRFTKRTGKLGRGLFGTLAQAFVFDEALVDPDHTTGSGWVLSLDASDAEHQDRIWGLVRRLLPLPTLDHWQAPLLEAIADRIHHQDRRHSDWPAIGRVRAAQVRLDDAVAETVSRLVRGRVLTRTPEAERPVSQASAA